VNKQKAKGTQPFAFFFPDAARMQKHDLRMIQHFLLSECAGCGL
jgi:hypothetical protein